MYVRREHNVQFDVAHGKDIQIAMQRLSDNKIVCFFFGRKYNNMLGNMVK